MNLQTTGKGIASLKMLASVLASLALVLALLPATAFAQVSAASEGDPIDLSSATVTVPVDSKGYALDASGKPLVYTGAEIKPVPTVKLGDTVLREGVDYTVSYDKNINVVKASSREKPTVFIQGIGAYTGNAKKTFLITPRTIDASMLTPIPPQMYTGSPLTPDLTITVDGKRLTVINDYSVTYSGTNAGKARASISGINNYTGKFVAEFQIIGTDISTTNITVSDAAYTGSAVTPAVTITHNGKELIEGTDYTLKYANNINIGKGKVTITGKAGFTDTTTVEFNITPNIVDSVITVGDQTYTGSELTPIATVKVGDKKLVENTDYTVEYKNNVNVGTATVTITGTGIYSGSKNATFSVKPADISSADVKDVPEQSYTGFEITPEPAVSLSGKALAKGKDYTVAYTKNTGIGTATITITGTGNYTGTKTANFKIINKFSPSAKDGIWRSNGSKWWYAYGNGGYAASEWVLINGKVYHFDASGWMQTGWQYIGGFWYHFGAWNDGSMQTGWIKVGSSWYLLDRISGEMKTGWAQDAGKWYYLNGNGSMATGWLKLGNAWYFLQGNGVMATGWVKSGNAWYYLNADGKMATGWADVDGKRYLLSSPNGNMLTGWQYVGNAWYYFDGSGAMVKNAWSGVYWLQDDGTMAINKWVDNDRLYVGSDGKVMPGVTK